MARRSDHSHEELEELILNRSWEILGKEGVRALTARRIATEIGYTPGTIYNFFESMDDLYLCLNERTLDALYDVLASPECNDPAKSSLQNMKKMAERYMGFAQEFRPYWEMLFSLHLPEARKNREGYQEKIDLLFLPLENLLAEFFSAHQHKKRKMAARVLWSSVHGLCLLQETGKIPLVGGKAQANEMVCYLIDTFVTGIKG
ncbi:MAG: TetR/AcrR family transcriptional regulator [Alphaproteobacteria bacterium]|jgi:AcrR family transcriptional regulator|nr:TetR/AcrR family transcriptional regulator [Alphaproteobacteria bacterium]